MLSWSANWTPLLSFRPDFILMSHLKMAAEKHHNHTESNICTRTQWTLCAKLKVLPVCGRHHKRWICSRFWQYLSSLCVFHIPKTSDYSLTSLGCEEHLPNWNYFRLLSDISCSTRGTSIGGLTVTPPGNVNIIAVDKVNPDNIGIAVGILFLCVLENR